MDDDDDDDDDDEVDTNCRGCYLAKLKKPTKNTRIVCFWSRDSKCEHKSEISYLLPYSAVRSPVPHNLTAGIARLMLSFITNGHGRKRP
jgi:hypothetical protein